MKILHVISTRDRAYGGPVRVVTELAAKQARLGHQVTVCATDRGHPSSKRLDHVPLAEEMAGVRVETFPVEFAPMLVSRKMGVWLRQATDTFDVVHIHGLYRYPTTYAASLARRRKVPYVVSPHGALDPFLYRRGTNGVLLKRLYEWAFDLPNLRAAAAVHYASDEERARANFLQLGSHSVVIPHGIDTDRFKQLPPRGAFRSRLAIGACPLVLFVGRINFKKGLDLLIPAFARVATRCPGARLVIAGPDAEGFLARVKEWLRQHQVAQLTKVVGILEPEATIQAYVDADVFVLPSYTENFGLAVMEAMACGTPVVISDQVNIHREVAAAGAGVITRCDEAEIADAISDMLDDSERRHRMGTAGRHVALSNYDWGRIALEVIQMYRTVSHHR